MKPTEKQVRFALFLLHKHGYRIDWFDSSFKRLGFTMRERSGKVENMSMTQCRKIIDGLKDE